MNAAAPPLPPDLLRVTQRLRMPYLRRHAPEVIAVAKAQRWDPAEVVRVLLEEEVKGRDDATRRNRRKAAGFPSGKTFEAWVAEASSIPLPTQIDQSMRVSWFSLERLATTVARSKVDASTSGLIRRICQADLIVVDDIGMLPAG